jgi:hypothetical protein
MYIDISSLPYRLLAAVARQPQPILGDDVKKQKEHDDDSAEDV